MSKSITITNDQVVRFVNALSAQRGETFEEVVNYLAEKAMKDMQYRSRRNAQKWQEQKGLKETVKMLEEKLQHAHTLQMIGAGREEEIEVVE
jgi:hypothetical protein